jgi:hypothetical protein
MQVNITTNLNFLSYEIMKIKHNKSPYNKLELCTRELPNIALVTNSLRPWIALSQVAYGEQLELSQMELMPLTREEFQIMGKVVFLKPWLLAADTSYYY